MSFEVPRRQVLVAAAALPALTACGSAPVSGFASWAEARQAIASLDAGWRNGGAWSLPQVLVHLAQSIEYSMDGFPEAKPAWFQATLGKAAFAVFDARGRMTHDLHDPIPGSPALTPAPLFPDAQQRLLNALERFEKHEGVLRPHFAYGALDKPSYTRAHLMHVANHWTEFVRS